MSGEHVSTMRCTQCGQAYPDAAALAAMLASDRAACSNCGSSTVVFGMGLSATVEAVASFVAHKPDRPGGTSGEAVRVGRGGADARSASADLAADGGLTDRIEGRASPKQSSELRTAIGLVGCLNSAGANWGTPDLRTGREDGVDCTADGADGATLRIQVTTPERFAWAELAHATAVDRDNKSVDRAVEAIRTAIESKALFTGLDTIVLALDATDSPRYAMKGVEDAFRARHGDWARGVGYQAIWVVGPAKGLVYKLDAAES